MMTKHTPGPWYAIGAWVEHPDDNVPDICTCSPHDMEQGHLKRNPEETAANARLISAAPDLLEALRWALDQIDDDLDPAHQAALASARAAIAQATGEQA